SRITLREFRETFTLYVVGAEVTRGRVRAPVREVHIPPEPGGGVVRSGLIRGRIPIVVAEARAPEVTELQAVADHDDVGSSVRHGGNHGTGRRVRVENQDVGGVAARGEQGAVVARAARIDVGGVRRVGGAQVDRHDVLADRDAVVRPAGAGEIVTLVFLRL